MADISELPFMTARIPLLDLVSNANPHDVKHSQDRTMLPVRKYFDAVARLRAARSETVSCLEARQGKADGVTLVICEKERFAALQAEIDSLQTQISALEGAIQKLDTILAENKRAGDWLSDIRHRLESAGSNVSRQQEIISAEAIKICALYPNLAPEEAMKDRGFCERRAECERLIGLDQEYLTKFKPVRKEIEAILAGVGC